ncbi:MAG: hypothetical protein KDK28_13300 [Maritimibacter sp.]|nr:hypothetical protein [Maritimibacter sp.]
MLAALPEADYAVAVAIAALPGQVRGYGHVKAASARETEIRRADLWARLVPVPASLRKAG